MTNAPTPHYTFESVVPHTGTMVLLDAIDHYTHTQLQASVTIRPNAPFTDDQGMPAWVGIELMAQTIAALAGARSRQAQQPIKIGFLVGSRRYSCNQGYFPLGAHLKVTATELIQADNGLCVFECQLKGTGKHAHIHAEANINVFQPEDPEEFLQQGRA